MNTIEAIRNFIIPAGSSDVWLGDAGYINGYNDCLDDIVAFLEAEQLQIDAKAGANKAAREYAESVTPLNVTTYYDQAKNPVSTLCPTGLV